MTLWGSKFALVVVVCTSATVLIVARPLRAQDVTHQLWIDYHRSQPLGGKWRTMSDGGLRTEFSNHDWGQAYIRPSIRYKWKENIVVMGGLGLFYTDNTPDPDQLETRPWQGVRYYFPGILKIGARLYFRLEERFIHTNGAGTDFTLRARIQAGARLPLPTHFQLLYAYFPAYIELFRNVAGEAAENFSSRLRIALGAGHVFGDIWAIEFYVILQESRSGGAETFSTADVIFRFELLQIIP